MITCRIHDKEFPEGGECPDCEGVNMPMSMRGPSSKTTADQRMINRVQKVSRFGSIQCRKVQCEKCANAANKGLKKDIKEVLEKLEEANEQGLIGDTLWYSDHETLFDFIKSLTD
ncbi:MAG: hypothetical protein KAJ10_03710 [Thermodesulfovibrionia bacterium]|nr:hypothetical protein [Thermodesulfovibrionia bacterium]